MVIKGFRAWNIQLRILASVVGILCVLLASCPVKAHIKNLWLAGNPIAKQKADVPQKTGEHKMLPVSASCVYETWIAKSSVRTLHQAGDDQARLSYSLIVLLGLCQRQAFWLALKRHPRYRSSKMMLQSVPLFLKFQRLLLHF